jgi:maleate isomerase
MPYSEKRIQSVISGPSSPSSPKVGMIVLSTDYTCERDYSRLAHAHNLDFDLYVNRISFENPMTEQSLAAMLVDLGPVATDILPDCTLDAIVFNCTSASALLGDVAVSEAIGRGKPYTPVLTTAGTSVAHILQAGHKKISLLAPYSAVVSRHLADYFEHNGLDVLSLGYMGIVDDRDVARLSTQTILDAAREAIVPGAEALFISCTATRAAEILPQLEQTVGIPVYSSNFCSFWQTMRILKLA